LKLPGCAPLKGDKPAAPPEQSGRPATFMGERSGAIIGIFALLCAYMAYVAAPILKPIAVAFLLSLIFVPVVRALARLHVPQRLSAAAIVLGIVALFGSAVYGLSEPAAEWLNKAPTVLPEIESKLRPIKEPIKLLQEAEKRISELADVGPAEPSGRPVRERPDLVYLIVSGAPQTFFGAVATFVLMFFMLASGNQFLRKLARAISTFGKRKQTVRTARNVQRQLSRYLSVITVINFTLGAVCTLALYYLEVPNPILWGSMIGLFNYVPYLGAMVSVTVVAVVCLLSFDHFWQMLLPPLTVGLLTTLEGQFITPTLAGRALSINPLAVFVFLFLMGWMWSVVGVLVAIPLLASFKLVCEDIERLRPIAIFLSKEV